MAVHTHHHVIHMSFVCLIFVMLAYELVSARRKLKGHIVNEEFAGILFVRVVLSERCRSTINTHLANHVVVANDTLAGSGAHVTEWWHVCHM